MALLRLPGSVAPVFEERLRHVLPDRADTILARLRRARGGTLYRSEFGTRMEGQDESWAATHSLFDLWCRRLGFESTPGTPQPSPFRRPGQGVQLTLL